MRKYLLLRYWVKFIKIILIFLTAEILGEIYQNYSDIFDRITPGIYLFNIENSDLLRERIFPKQGIINVND